VLTCSRLQVGAIVSILRALSFTTHSLASVNCSAVCIFAVTVAPAGHTVANRQIPFQFDALPKSPAVPARASFVLYGTIVAQEVGGSTLIFEVGLNHLSKTAKLSLSSRYLQPNDLLNRRSPTLLIQNSFKVQIIKAVLNLHLILSILTVLSL
jgi:hypothetical protein